VFRLRLSTAYITTAKIYLMVFYCLFQDNILGFNMFFPIRCLGFYSCLCISYAPFLVTIFLIITPHPIVFTQIIWDLLGWISGSNMFALMFLILFSLYFSCGYGGHFSINKVLPPTWLRRIKNRNSYKSLLRRLAKPASQPPSYLRSIIHNRIDCATITL